MAIDESERPDIEKAWSKWTKNGKQDVHAALEKDDPYAATSVDENMTDADIGPRTYTRVQIVQLMKTTLTDIHNYIDPSEIGPQSASDVGTDATSSVRQTTPLTIFASLKDIAQSHNLCRKQYYVFLLLGASLLHYLLITMYGQETVDAACEPLELTDTDDDGSKEDLRSIMRVIKHLLGTEPGSNKIRQLVMFFGGEAGTGKTEVTKAVTTLAKLWRVSHVLRKTATTGAAASLIGGSTIHILASLMQQLKTVNFAVGLIIALLLIDEVSMFQRNLNGYLTQTLQKLLNGPLQVLGGVHVGYLGDLFQLPPVKGEPVYQRNINKQGVQISSTASNGEAIWHDALHTVILLDKNFRQEDDNLLELCRAVRLGNVTTHQLAELNNRVITEANVPPIDSLFIFPENRQVLGVNTIMVHRYAQHENIPVIRLLAYVYNQSRERGNTLITNKSHPVYSGFLVNMPSTDTWRNGLLSILDLHYGAPVILTNIGNDLQMKYNIGNNTNGTFVGLWPPSSNENLTGKQRVSLVSVPVNDYMFLSMLSLYNI